MSDKIKIASEGKVKYITKALLPVLDEKEAAERVQHKLGEYPLYAFLLYDEMDDDLTVFVRMHGGLLHGLSGNDCLLSVFENPGDWGEGWKRYWQQKLGPDFDKMLSDWIKLKPFDRNTSYQLADYLQIDRKALPCIIFVESFLDKRFMYLPIIKDKGEYHDYFKDLFTAVRDATNEPAGKRIDKLRSEWKRLWLKWILPQKVKTLASDIQDWGSVIKTTKDSLVSAFEPITPILHSIFPGIVK
jgi:hypothetical protein